MQIIITSPALTHRLTLFAQPETLCCNFKCSPVDTNTHSRPWVIVWLYLALALHASGVGCKFASLSNAAHFPQIVSVISLQNNSAVFQKESYLTAETRWRYQVHPFMYRDCPPTYPPTHTRGNRGNANVASSTAFINRGQLHSPARGPVITFTVFIRCIRWSHNTAQAIRNRTDSHVAPVNEVELKIHTGLMIHC
jgi:hypothetical protein